MNYYVKVKFLTHHFCIQENENHMQKHSSLIKLSWIPYLWSSCFYAISEDVHYIHLLEFIFS